MRADNRLVLGARARNPPRKAQPRPPVGFQRLVQHKRLTFKKGVPVGAINLLRKDRVGVATGIGVSLIFDREGTTMRGLHGQQPLGRDTSRGHQSFDYRAGPAG